MKRKYIIYTALLLLLGGCKKIDHLVEKEITRQSSVSEKPALQAYIPFIIPKGEHYATNNVYTPIETYELKFMVKFDSSAIYTSKQAVNQYDINKLYGFSDNDAHHHQYSARFGWSWTKNALHLYAYVYNEGLINKTDLGTVAIGAENRCTISISGSNYIFRVNESKVSVPRKSTMPAAKGYLLYPYFGGDETAPHNITIQIKNL